MRPFQHAGVPMNAVFSFQHAAAETTNQPEKEPPFCAEGLLIHKKQHRRSRQHQRLVRWLQALQRKPNMNEKCRWERSSNTAYAPESMPLGEERKRHLGATYCEHARGEQTPGLRPEGALRREAGGGSSSRGALRSHLPSHHDDTVARQDVRGVLGLGEVVLDDRRRHLEELHRRVATTNTAEKQEGSAQQNRERWAIKSTAGALRCEARDKAITCQRQAGRASGRPGWRVATKKRTNSLTHAPPRVVRIWSGPVSWHHLPKKTDTTTKKRSSNPPPPSPPPEPLSSSPRLAATISQLTFLSMTLVPAPRQSRRRQNLWAGAKSRKPRSSSWM